MERIKIAQIGVCHEHAPGKIISLRRLPEIYEIVGYVDDHDFSKSPRFTDETPSYYEGLRRLTLDEALHYPGLEAVTVEVPNNELVPMALRCMERNLAMHMDKPAGEDLELYKKLLDGCRERKLPFQMGFMFRNNPAMLLCRRAVREGWLGDVFEIQASMSHNYGGDAYQEYIGRFPGGIMYNLGCHFVDFVVSVLGRPEKITPFLKSAPGYPDRIRNNCVAILEYPHATATLRACSQEVNGSPRRRLRVCGTRGSVELCPLEHFDGKPLEMLLTLKEANAEYPAGPSVVNCGIVADRYEDQLRELAKIIRGEMANPYTYEHDYLVHEVTLAASGYRKWR